MTFIRLINTIFFIVLLHSSMFSQQLFESGIVYGGVTGGGFSTNTGSGTVSSTVLIPPNSSIKKAYLLATRDGVAPDITVVLNGNNLTFNGNTVVSSGFISTVNSWIWSNSSINALDITQLIDSSVNSYSLSIPPQFNVTVNGFYSSFYLYIVYENTSLPKTAYSLFVNQQDVAITVNYNLSNLSPVSTINPVGFGVFGVFFCDTLQDGSFFNVNGNSLGLLGGQESNTIHSCTGVYPNFSYFNNTLIGLEDDTPDSLMTATDALADIKSYVNNGDTIANFVSTLQTPGIGGGKLTNPIAALMLSYSTPCSPFTTTATPTQDTICKGESVQLAATGGLQYSWFGAFGGLSDSTLANPVASPPQTTTYIVTIKNDSGCVKTEHVKIWVRPEPKPDTIAITPQTCGNQNGKITVGIIPQGTPPFTYTLTNLQTNTSITQTNNVFNQLSTFNFQLLTEDNNGCTWLSDTLFVPQINNVTANFTSVPQAPFSNPTQPLGKAPMEVSFLNTSQNANSYQWTITEQPNNDTLIQHSTFNTQHFFTQGGIFEVCLIAYNNLPLCADTVCKTIFIDKNENVSVFIPNVFTPNGDNENDDFSVQIFNVELLEILEVQVFNRWGSEMLNVKFEVLNNERVVLWDGTTTAGKKASEGTYFYVLSYQTKAGETTTQKGTVSLLR